MQYVLLIYDDEAAWAAFSEDERNEVMQQYYAYGAELRAANALVGGEALQPTQTATTVKVRGGEQVVTDGPFAETKEQIGGFYVFECKSEAEALAYAAKIPGAAYGSIEVRQIIEM
jgi:hypothetical protein